MRVSLSQVVAFIRTGTHSYALISSTTHLPKSQDGSYRFGFFWGGVVRGQEMAKLTITLAVAGGHNLLMVGPV